MYLLEKYFPIFLQRTCLVQIGSNILPSKSKNKKEELFEKYSLINGAPIIANFGMSYAGKGMSLLLEITRKIIYCHKRDIRLLLIGGGISDSQDHIDDRKNKIREFGLENKVICTGNIPAEEVSELFNLSSAVVMPFRSGASDRRGSLLAALSHNKAIVTTIPELKLVLLNYHFILAGQILRKQLSHISEI
jgi:glycosyltransferase involved in cell wall biosynthesis